MDEGTDGLTEQMYCSQQIHVPLNLPYILKQYAKAAIRTQPSDLLYWSAVYFRALADDTTPPVKDRLEYPPLTSPSGLSPGFLKVLIKMFGKKVVIREDELVDKWLGVGLKLNFLMELFRLTDNENGKVRWLNFVAVAAGHLCPSLTQTMILICELLTDDPEGGPAAIKLDLFLPVYKFLARLNCGPVIKYDAVSANTTDEIYDTRPHSLSSLQDNKETEKSTDAICEPAAENAFPDIGEKYASDAGLPVWEDVRPNVFKKSTSPRPSSEGMTSEAGIVVFERINEDFPTPGFTSPQESEPVEPTKSKEIVKPKTPQKVNKELIHDFEGIEIPSQDLAGTDDTLDKIVSAYGEEVNEEETAMEEDAELDDNGENQPPIEDAETVALDEQGVDDAVEDQDTNDERRISKELKEQFKEEKRLREAEKAERKRLREEARAQKRLLKEQRKAEAATAKGDKQGDVEKKATRKRKKLIKADQDEAQGEAEEMEEDEEGSVDEMMNEEDLDEESSTASSSISIDPDLEVFSSSEILGEDEYWEVIEIEEESLDDEEQKIIRKIKKRVKRKIEKKVEEIGEEAKEEVEDAKKAVMSDENKKQIEDSISVEVMQGKPKDEVRASGIINLHPDGSDITSLVSEPEQFEASFTQVAGIGPIVPENQIKAVVKYMTEWASKQGGYVMPRNIRHFLCPPLDAVMKNDENR